MGLGIYSYSALQTLERIHDKDDQIAIEIWEDRYWMQTDNKTMYIWPFPPDHFPGREAPFKFPPEGSIDVYQYQEQGEPVSFSYSGYYTFRAAIAKMATSLNLETYWSRNDPNLPFYELIDFSDCEGYIGTDACKELASDFEAYKERAELELGDWLSYYHQLAAAVKLASNGGLLKLS